MRSAALLAALFVFASNSRAQSHGVITPQLRLQRLVVSDASAHDLARRALRAEFARVLHCYEIGLALAPDLAGHVRVRMEVATETVQPSRRARTAAWSSESGPTDTLTLSQAFWIGSD